MDRAGESVRAFLPAPLPPAPPVYLGVLHPTLESAALAVGRLDGISDLLPDRALFRHAFVRKEAVLSSRIEGTRSSLSDLLLFESEERPGVPLDDVTEVSNCVAALEHGLQRLRSGFPLSNRLLREMHGILLSRGIGAKKDPGAFRRSQNRIGGSRPGNAVFAPPPPGAVPDCMTELESFLHATDGLPVLVRAGLAHVQFETIHPFLDGNGRIGRLLITLLLHHAGLLREPLLYLGLHFNEHRSDYYRLLDGVRRTGDWEAWLGFFLDGVRTTAENAVATALRAREMFADERSAIEQRGGRRAGSVLRVYDALKALPILSLSRASSETRLSFPAASAAMGRLVAWGIAREITGRRRGRLFVHDRYLGILTACG